jgi:hypothetical protein
VKSSVNRSWVFDLYWKDPCLTRDYISFPRLVSFALLFLTFIGGAIFLALLEHQPYEIQFTSMVMYTAAVALYTFSRNRNGAQPFLLSCPVVRHQLPRLIRRHLGFLAVLLIAQTTALKLRSNLPAHWVTPSSRDASPFAVILGVLCLCLGVAQILSNRSLLEDAHLSVQTDAFL